MNAKRHKKLYSKIRHFFQNMSIRNKFICIFIPVLVFVVVMILVVTNSFLYNSNINKTMEIVEDECEIIQVRLESMKENLITCTNMIAKDINRIYSDTNMSNLDHVSFVSIKNDIYTALDYDKRCFGDIASIIFIDEKANMVSAGLDITPEISYIQEELIPLIPEKGMPKEVQLSVEKRDEFDLEEPVLTVGKRIIMMETGETIGYIFLNVKESKISSIFPEAQGEYLERQFYLVDHENRIVSAMDKRLLLKTVEDKKVQTFLEVLDPNSQIKVEGRDYLFTKKEVSNLQWQLVSQTSVGSLTEDIKMTSWIIILLGVLGIGAAVVLTILFSRLITKPIGILTDAAVRLQNGDFTVRCEMNSKDEVGIFSITFQTMILKIEGLLNQVKEEQTRKRAYELALIQAQIKPHFLYNTLDLIYIFSESNMPEKAAGVTKSLADFYRTSLSSGEEVITIREELKNIENYLFIQRERYFDLMDYMFQCDPLIEEYHILKLTLQPLVENAIYHGLKLKGENGMIWITGSLEDADIILRVRDNGIGMSKEKIIRIMEQQEMQHHFGIRNVKQRLRLYYGEDTNMEVQSEPGKGTEIIIRISKTVGAQSERKPLSLP